MAFYGPLLPDDIIQKSDEYGSPLQINRMTGALLSGQHEFTNIFASTGAAVQKAFYKEFDPGTVYSKQDWEKSPYYRPGLDVNGDISENVAQLEAMRYDNNRAYEAQINALPKGFLSGAATFVGGNIGAVLNPIMALSGMGFGYLAGKGAASLLGEIAATTTTKAARGAMIGAATNFGFLAPAETANYFTESYLDQNPSGLAAIASVGIGTGIGALIGGGVGAILPFKKCPSLSTFRFIFE